MENKTMPVIETELRPAAIAIVRAIADAIRIAEEIPSGHLYAMLMEFGIELQAYQNVIDLLIRAELIEKDRSHLLRWIGPKEAK